MTTHELAELLLSNEDSIIKLGRWQYGCGCEYWETVEDIEVTFGEEYCLIEEKQ